LHGLKTRARSALAALAVVMALLLFLPAATLHYWQAWVYLVIFVGASWLTTVYLERNDPALLERRMRGGPTAEMEPRQKVIMLGASLGFIALLAVPALDRRFQWSVTPVWLAVGGDILTAVGFYLIFRVYRVNTFTAATIQVIPDQHVVSTGPYAIVRHPMYASASLYVIGTPLALGSYWGLLAAGAMLPFLIWRLLDEERLLARSLSGYTEYQKKVPYRLVPRIW
jgi:protein-S-isoprenylcysteine O-methyltransferase Ste14